MLAPHIQTTRRFNRSNSLPKNGFSEDICSRKISLNRRLHQNPVPLYRLLSFFIYLDNSVKSPLVSSIKVSFIFTFSSFFNKCPSNELFYVFSFIYYKIFSLPVHFNCKTYHWYFFFYVPTINERLSLFHRPFFTCLSFFYILIKSC